MKYKKLLELAGPYLKENDLGVSHTTRVLDIAKKNYQLYGLDEFSRDIVYSLIVLHDIGGSKIKDQYEKGPKIAKELLTKLNFHRFDIMLICECIARHHERLPDPHDIFKILFDSDQLVKFSDEEFNHYNSNPNFDWNKVMASFYNENVKNQAEALLNGKKTNNKD